MTLSVRWRAEAERTLDEYLAFLAAQRTSSAAILKLLDRIDTLLLLVSRYPELYPRLDDSQEIRVAVVTSHLSLVYLREDRYIDLLTFWDTRRDPTTRSLPG